MICFFFNIFKIVIILIVNILLSQYIFLFIKKLLEKKIKDKIMYLFLINLFKYIIYIILLLILLESINIKTSPLIAVLGTLGLTIGLSLKNSFSNLSSGILIIILELFKIGDVIEIEKIQGKVSDIKIFTTTLITKDKKVITIPNNKFLINNIINFSNFIEKKNLQISYSIDKNLNFKKEKFKINNILNKFIRNKKFKNFSIEIKDVTNFVIEILIKIQTLDEVKNSNLKSEILENIINKTKKK